MKIAPIFALSPGDVGASNAPADPFPLPSENQESDLETETAFWQAAVYQAEVGVMRGRHEAAGQVVLTQVNPAFERITGYTQAEVIGRDAQFLLGAVVQTDAATGIGATGTAATISPATAVPPNAVSALSGALEAGRALDVTVLTHRKDGSSFWGALQLWPVRGAQDAMAHWTGFLCDVSARVEAQSALRQSHENLAAAQSLTHLGSWFYELGAADSAQNPLIWSDEVFRIFGLEPGAVAPSRELYLSLVHPDDRPRALHLDEIFAAGTDYEAKLRIVRPDGGERVVLVRARVERDGEGAARRAVGTLLDISERQRGESRARQARRHLQLVMQNAPIVIWALDGEGTVTLVEGIAAQKLTGGIDNSLDGEHQGRSIFEIYRAYPAVCDLAQRALSGEEVSAVVEINGLFFDVEYLPLRGDAKAPCGAVGMAYDITERRETERALRQSQARLGSVIENVPVLLWAIDRDGVFTLAQGRALETLLETLKLAPEQVVGQSLFVLFGEQAPLSQLARRALAGEEAQQVIEVLDHAFEMHYGPSRDEQGQISGAVGVSYLVTERERAKRALEQSEARFNRIVANAPGMVYSFRRDLEGQIRFLFVSEGCREIYGLEAAAIQNDPQRIIELMQPDTLEDFHRSIGESQRDLAPWHWEGRIVRPDGESRWLRAQSRPALQPDGSTVWDGLVMDVTQTRIAQEEILRSRRALDEGQALAHIGSFEWNLQSGEVRWSNELFRIFGFEPQSFAPTPAMFLSLIAESEREAVRERAVRVVQTARAEAMTVPITRADGEVRWLEGHTRAEVDDAGRVIYIVGSAQDITESLQTSQLLRQSEQRYALAARGANDGMWDWDLAANQIYFSPRWKTMLGFAETEIGDNPDEWLGRVHSDDIEHLRLALRQHLAGETEHFECEYRVHCADGTTRWMLCRALAVFRDQNEIERAVNPTAERRAEPDAAPHAAHNSNPSAERVAERPAERVGNPSGNPSANLVAERIAGSQTDITTRKAAEAQLSRNAFYDHLTGLPNRTLFLERLERTLSRSRRNPDYAFATLFLDIDRFKKINDSFGHMVGDALLIEAAARFSSCLRPGDTVARLGGDEFALLVDDVREESEVSMVASRIQKALEAPFDLEGKKVFATVSIGIAPYRGGGQETPEDLLRNADSAMYRAKGLGRARFETFDAAMHQSAVKLLELETDLWHAIERDELCLHYQPIISLPSGQIRGYEALVRWQHPTRGLIAPADFIPLAEENGFIVPLGWWVLEEACRQWRAWQELRAARFPGEQAHFMAVNLSSKQFSQPGFVEQVRQILLQTGADPHHLTLEITESVIMEHSESASTTLRSLQAMGIRLSMDDFGTGYSSLSYLHRFSFDTLKIDRSFVSQMRADSHDGEIVGTILALAGGLRLEVVAEGVETAAQLSELRRMKCGFAQGSLFSPPLPGEKIEELWERAAGW